MWLFVYEWCISEAPVHLQVERVVSAILGGRFIACVAVVGLELEVLVEVVVGGEAVECLHAVPFAGIAIDVPFGINLQFLTQRGTNGHVPSVGFVAGSGFQSAIFCIVADFIAFAGSILGAHAPLALVLQTHGHATAVHGDLIFRKRAVPAKHTDGQLFDRIDIGTSNQVLAVVLLLLVDTLSVVEG